MVHHVLILAGGLKQGGVDGVVAMSRSVLVVSATKYVEAFYRHLAQGTPVPIAHERARQALHDDPARHLHRRRRNEEAKAVILHDWWLPHYYQQRPLALTPPLTPNPSTLTPSPSPPERGEFNDAMPSEPLYGFSGRARELLTIERTLLRSKMVVLHGFGGIGKTALAREAADWLTQTGMYTAAYFHSFEHGSDAVALLSGLGTFLGVYDSSYNPQEPDTALAKLRPVLAKRPLLIIADNLEDILPNGNAPLPSPLTPNPSPPGRGELGGLLSAEERQQLWDVFFELKGLGAGLLLTTRDTTFGDRRLAKGKSTRHLHLGGLAPNDAYTLATRLLDDLDISRRKAPYAPLRDLLKQLDHHPLAIQLVLPALEHHSLDTIRQYFAKLLNEFKDDTQSGRNRSLLVSLDYSLKRLTEQQRALLPRLAVFEGGVQEGNLLAITEIPESEWSQLRAALEQAALITTERIDGVDVPFLHFHPVLAPYLRSQPGATNPTLRQRYATRYHALANYLYHEDNRNPIPVRALVGRELPNLRRALDYLLTQGDYDSVSNMIDKITRFLNNFGMWRERDEMRQKVAQAVLDKPTGFTYAEWLHESGLGEDEWQRGNLQAAYERFSRLLTRIESQPHGTSQGIGSYEHCLTLGRLARCLTDGGQHMDAEKQLRRALTVIEVLIAFKPDNKSYICQRSVLFTDLGNVLIEQGNYAPAKAAYEKGLTIAKQQDDTRLQGVILGQLGTLFFLQRNYHEAEEHYHEALLLFHTINQPASEAVQWHQLGIVAQEQKQFRDAERCYRQSLTLSEQQGNAAKVAGTCNMLAIVTVSAGKPAEALGWFKRALAIDEQVHPGSPLHASHLNNLAAFLLEQERANRAPANGVASAQGYAERALAIYEKLEPSSEIWKTLHILAQIAKMEGHSADAKAFRRRERETFAAFAGNRWHIEQEFGEFIMLIAAAAQKDVQMQAVLEVEFVKLEELGWHIAGPTRRIWAGERDWHALCEGLNGEESLLVKMVLERLADSAPVKATDVGRERDVYGASAALSEPVTPEMKAMLKQFEPLLAAIVAVARGDESQRHDIELFLPTLEAQGWQLNDAVQRIWAGERDVAALVAGLDEKSALLVRQVVEML